MPPTKRNGIRGQQREIQALNKIKARQLETLRELEEERDRLRSENEQLRQENKNLQVDFDTVSTELGATKNEKAKLRQQTERLQVERDTLREDNHRGLQNQRRKRIEDWRSAISNHEFGGYPRFASTVAYSQLKPHLRPEVIEMLEAPRTFHVGNEARGDWAYEYTLLDEVARIEKEWDLI